ncbi:replication initiation protein [Campylobacter sp. MIT 97-5078]|uniref:replication initiation protein n=1 Tax=Campylobacter sp. MIT 97-5078 TaxID=1548153 RepID=UPI0005140FF0|nr:replication initiation protein [Campylobacter sp. MIT 97-5078]KGI55305.1 hypothetical protein LR59_12660 [Campylobacter sp. MIT 97-5078]TQR25569.1 RepB family plasmid replication initiator protein [Campylobacter sp. MIT 97-5078]
MFATENEFEKTLPEFFFSKENIDLAKNEKLKVSYKNSFYNIIFPDFNSIDFNFLFGLFYLLKEKRDSKIKVNFIFFTNLINKKFYALNKKRFFKEFNNFCEKAIKVYFLKKEKNEDNFNNISYFSLFSYIHIDEKEGCFTISFSKYIINILNDVNESYTFFNLKDFCNIKTKYAKLFYLLFIRFIYNSKFVISKEEFYKYCSLNNKKYLRQIDIDDKVIKPAIKELKKSQSIFKNLSVIKIKKGNMVKAFEFIFER